MGRGPHPAPGATEETGVERSSNPVTGGEEGAGYGRVTSWLFIGPHSSTLYSDSTVCRCLIDVGREGTHGFVPVFRHDSATFYLFLR